LFQLASPGPRFNPALERLSFERNRSNDKKSLKIKMLEQALIEKVYQLSVLWRKRHTAKAGR
jgi:hypothetical protein